MKHLLRVSAGLFLSLTFPVFAAAQVTPSVSITSLSPGTSVNVGMTVFFNAAGAGFTNPVYTISDSTLTSSITSAAMNASGGFRWTPLLQDVGSHTLTVVASDASGASASVTQSISVIGPPSASVQSLLPGATTTPGQTITFSVAASNFTNPAYTISDSLFGSSIGAGNINPATGSFIWTPGPGDVGVHTLSVQVRDSLGNNASVLQQISVQNASISIGSVTPSKTVTAGTAVSFGVDQFGFTASTSYTLSDSFAGTTLSNADISSDGAFLWTPAAKDVGVHGITVYASDANSHTANATVTVVVNPATTTESASPAQSSSQTAPSGTPSPAGYVFNANLAIGSTGADVTALQTLLSQKGFYSGSPTGYFGQLTAAAVKAFQAANNLPQLGSVGPLTRAALGSTSPAGTPAAPASGSGGYTFSASIGIGSTGTDVTELQKHLAALGIYSGPVTGYFGPLTAIAVKAFQGAHGLEQVGYVGPATRAVLNKGL